MDGATDLIYCSVSCCTKHVRHKAILGQGEGKMDENDSGDEVEFIGTERSGTKEMVDTDASSNDLTHPL